MCHITTVEIKKQYYYCPQISLRSTFSHDPFPFPFCPWQPLSALPLWTLICVTIWLVSAPMSPSNYMFHENKDFVCFYSVIARTWHNVLNITGAQYTSVGWMNEWIDGWTVEKMNTLWIWGSLQLLSGPSRSQIMPFYQTQSEGGS